MTLIETLVVIALLGALALLSMGGIKRMRTTSRNIGCVSNLRQLAIANLQYSRDHRGFIVGGSGNTTTAEPDGAAPDRRYWWWRLVPYLGGNADDRNTAIKTLICPGDPARGGEGYAVYENKNAAIWKRSYGLNDFLHYQTVSGFPTKRMLDFSYPSRTALCGDIAWYKQGTHYIRDIAPWTDNMPNDWHGVEMNIVFLDGHVERFRRETLLPGKENHWIWNGDAP